MKTRLGFSIHFILSQSFNINNAWKFYQNNLRKLCWPGHVPGDRISLTSKKLPRAFSSTLQPSLMYFVEKDSKDKLLRRAQGKKTDPSFVSILKNACSCFWHGIAHASPLNLIVVVQSDSCDRHMNSKFARAMASCSRFHLLEVKVSLKWYVSTSKKGKEKHSSSDLCYQDASSFGSALSRCSIFWQVVQAGSANLAS